MTQDWMMIIQKKLSIKLLILTFFCWQKNHMTSMVKIVWYGVFKRFLIIFQYFCIACHRIILIKKWNKTNRKYAKLYWLTYKILTFNIIVRPNMSCWKTKSSKFSPNFLCFAISPFCSSLITWYSKIIECCINNNLFQ